FRVAGRVEERERRGDDEFARRLRRAYFTGGDGGPLRAELLRIRPRLGAGLIHLPVRDEESSSSKFDVGSWKWGHGFSFRLPTTDLQLATASSASIPGSFPSARNSSEAPPPVDTCVNFPATPAACAAWTLSPPPTTVTAGDAATMRARAIVPLSNGGFSKTPIGPFQKIVFAGPSRRSNCSSVRGPTSRAMSPSGILLMRTVCALAPSSGDFATTKSEGSAIVLPASLQ